MNTKNILYLSHGGGPLPLLGDEGHTEMVRTLKEIANNINKPSAIIVVSAHWEEQQPTIRFGKNPSLIYDYYGFPKESYSIDYPCPGEPELAEQVFQSLSTTGLKPEKDFNRGFDHGLFVPLTIMYPKADIPCIQLSIMNNLDPADHLSIGQALHNIHYNNLLIIGSGFSFHNLRAFFTIPSAEPDIRNIEFEEWLLDTMTNQTLDEKSRTNHLLDWANAPHARYCHPREDHLIPLHVCYGAAQENCKYSYELNMLNKKSSMYLW